MLLFIVHILLIEMEHTLSYKVNEVKQCVIPWNISTYVFYTL